MTADAEADPGADAEADPAPDASPAVELPRHEGSNVATSATKRSRTNASTLLEWTTTRSVALREGREIES